MNPRRFLNDRVELHHGDSRDVLRSIADASIDSVVTDPPYALVSIVKRFGGENAAPSTDKSGESGPYMRASAGFMGQQWDTGETAFAVEFWAEVFRVLKPGGHVVAFSGTRTYHRLAAAIEDSGFEIRDQLAWVYGTGFPKSHTIKAGEFAGWGTALKPAWEPIALARKPLIGTVAANVLQHRTGAINVEGCRIGAERLAAQEAGQARLGTFEREGMITPERVGRFPANILHDGSPEVVGKFPDGAARFFYSAKADSDDRLASKHPTVKPVNLMQWLCRLVTPRGGVVLDPFAGSGTTGEAAWREGFRAVLIEREANFVGDIARRLELADRPTKRAAVAKTKNQIDDLGPLFSGVK